MSTRSTVYLFGDQAGLSKDDLRALLLLNHDQVLNQFLDQAAFSLRQEIQNLPWAKREQFPTFANLFDLLAIDSSKPLHPALHLALSTVHHLALFILQRESELKNLTSSDLCHVAGFGSGLLAAVAASCFPERGQLVTAGQQMVLVSFRIGVLAADARLETDNASKSTVSWRVCVETENAGRIEELLSNFSSSKGLIPWTSPYTCGKSRTSVFIGGAPDTLTEFLEENKLTAVDTGIHAPFHTANTFSANDVERITRSLSAETLSAPSKFGLLLPRDTQGVQEAETLESLLRIAVDSVLRQPVAGAAILGAIANAVDSAVSDGCTVVAIGTDDDTRLASAVGAASTFISTKDIMAELPSAGKTRQPKLAITGFSGRFPKAQNLEAFWEVLHGGVDTHSKVPPSRWDAETHVDPTGKRKNTSATPFGCWLDEPGLFDRSFFSISPREAPQMDPAQRLALMCAYEAIEMSGIVPDATPSTIKSRVGVFIGCTSNDWCETNSAQDVDFYFIPGGNRAFIPGRINYFFKFSGPSFAVDTACSSSLAAIHLACNALWRREVDTAIVGGTNILTNPDVTAGLDRGHFLSRTGNCKSFDDGADGYCRGEGVGIMVLKRLDDAQAENDTVYATILSAATNHSAEAESITRPHVGAQQALFSQVLAQAGIRPNDVGYVEMHGTGTQAGDGREMSSVSSTFAPFTPGDARGRDSDLYVGSVKANVGHGEAVSGVTALTKILLMLQKNEIVPHAGIKTALNRTFPADLEARRVKIARAPVPWPPHASGRPRRVLVNNFSAAGGNSCILVEEAPPKPTRTTRQHYDSRPAHVLTVSAKTKTALEANLRAMAGFLQASHSVPLSDMAYTATARRLHYNYRAAFVAPTVQEMRRLVAQEAAAPQKQFRGPPRMVFAFAGQGSTHAGMARHLYARCATFRADAERLDAACQRLGFGPVLPFLRADAPQPDAPPLTVQLGHVCLQIALARLWRSWGVSPAAVVGHSLGEYAALVCAGVLADVDALWLVGRRAQLLADHCAQGTHSMLAVRAGRAEVAAQLHGVPVELACANGAQETVVGGALEAIDDAVARLTAAGIRSTRVALPYAFHSSQVDPILDPFSALLDHVRLRAPRVPLLSPLLAKVVGVGEAVPRDYLRRQCREAVDLLSAVQAGRDAGLLDERAHLLELGPSLVLSRLVKHTLGSASPAAVIPSLHPTQDSALVLANSVAQAYRVGCNVNWAQYHQDYEHAVVRLPSYSWDLKNYWLQYVNDWSLRKGEPWPVAGESQFELETTSCQNVVSADLKGDTLRLLVQSDLQSESLRPVVSGHTVNGIAVCIGSVYSDMAKACGDAILKCFKTDPATTAVLVEEMNMQESLTINESRDPQLISIEVSCSWKTKKAAVSITSGGKVNATAVLRFTDRQQEQALLKKSLRNSAFNISVVKEAAADGEAARFTCAMAYRMVASLAHYDATHKGVKEVTLNSDTMEASSLVASKPQHRMPGTFGLHPCVFDSILQLGTFVMNANENSRFDQEVYVVRGWDTVFVDEVLDDAKQYETYVKMTAQDKDLATGDIAILHEGTPVGCIKGVRVQRVPRRLMDVMFRPKAVAAPAPLPTNTATPAASSAAPSAAAPAAVPNSGAKNIEKALAIVAEESGHSLEELKDDDQLADIGIDSLLILVIVSRFHEELNVELQPADFMDISSIGALKYFFNGGDSAQPDSDSSSSAASPDPGWTEAALMSDTSPSSDAAESVDEAKSVEKVVTTTSAVLQGPLNGTSKIMFLFPDGSGSATSYMNLPRVDKEIAVVGINCPYMQKPQEMKGSFEDITRILLAEVRRRQPKGPYYLGGWSAGGAFAYCATQMLLEAGEEVEALVLIDAPCPIGLGKLPQIFFDFWKTIHEPGGPVADRPIPHWLMDHFQAVNKNLRDFTACPLPPGRSPKTFVAWAARGTDNLAGFQQRHLLTPEESEDLGFLMDDKTNFGPRGWERLLEGNLIIETAMTSNHFTIVRGEGAKLLSGMIKRACLA